MATAGCRTDGRTSGRTVKGAVKAVVELYKSGLSPREISKIVYGSDSLKFRRRVFRYIWYARKTGLLSYHVVADDTRGEAVDPSTGVVVREREVGETFIPHSRPVSNSAPFMGSYRNVRQLKASLKREEVRVVNVLSLIDRIMGPLGYSHDSMVREEAMYLGRRFARVGSVKEVAAAAAFAAVLLRRACDLRLLIEAIDANGIDSLPVSLLLDMLDPR